MKNPHSKRVPAADANQNTETKSEVAVERDDIYCCCNRCKRKRLLRVFLPQELFFQILTRLPAQVICDAARYVCQEWKDMIHTRDFVYHHLMHSTPGLLIYGYNIKKAAIFVAMGKGGIELSKVDYRFPNEVRNSCNGLVLVPEFTSQYCLYVINPVINQQITLTPFDRPVTHYNHCGLAYAMASMEYKVVQSYFCRVGAGYVHIAILTVGVDKAWRHVNTEHFSRDTRKVLYSSPLVTGGFMHWIGNGSVLTLNVETETIFQFSIPGDRKAGAIYLPMGSNLSLVRRPTGYSLELLEMKSETGEWTKLQHIDIRPQGHTLRRLLSAQKGYPMPHRDRLTPVGWLKFREVLVFSVSSPSRLCIAIDIKTLEIFSFKLKDISAELMYKVHVNSLVWGC